MSIAHHLDFPAAFDAPEALPFSASAGALVVSAEAAAFAGAAAAAGVSAGSSATSRVRVIAQMILFLSASTTEQPAGSGSCKQPKRLSERILRAFSERWHRWLNNRPKSLCYELHLSHAFMLQPRP